MSGTPERPELLRVVRFVGWMVALAYGTGIFVGAFIMRHWGICLG